MQENLMTFSMRLDNKVIKDLKKRAKIESIKHGNDISYVDLARNYINRQIESDNPCLVDEADSELLQYIRPAGRFWTKEEKRVLNESELGKNLQKCIDSEDFSFYTDVIKQMIDIGLKYNSVSRKLLVVDERDKKDPIAEIDRNIASVAQIIARRGAVPDKISEGETFLLPEFEIAAFPTIRQENLSPSTLLSCASSGVNAIQSELDRNVIALLTGSVENKGTQIVVNIGSLTVCALVKAIGLVCQHGVAASYIIMNPLDYIGTLVFGIDFFETTPTLTDAFKTGYYGHFLRTEVLVTNAVPKNTILVCADKGILGVCVSKNTKAMHEKEQKKLREGFVLSTTTGLAAVNDWAIAKIEITAAT